MSIAETNARGLFEAFKHVLPGRLSAPTLGTPGLHDGSIVSHVARSKIAFRKKTVASSGYGTVRAALQPSPIRRKHGHRLIQRKLAAGAVHSFLLLFPRRRLHDGWFLHQRGASLSGERPSSPAARSAVRRILLLDAPLTLAPIPPTAAPASSIDLVKVTPQNPPTRFPNPGKGWMIEDHGTWRFVGSNAVAQACDCPLAWGILVLFPKRGRFGAGIIRSVVMDRMQCVLSGSRARATSLIGVLLATLLWSAAGVAEPPYKIAIDPAYGGDRGPGKPPFCDDLYKGEITLQVGLMLRDLMDRDPDLDPIMTRDSDVERTLETRLSVANERNADRLLSLRLNVVGKVISEQQKSGILTIRRESASQDALNLSNFIKEAMGEVWGELPNHGVQAFDYRILTEAQMPATITKLAFVDNCAQDASLLRDPVRLKQAAYAHHRAVRRSLGLAGHPDVSLGWGAVGGTVTEDRSTDGEDGAPALLGAWVGMRKKRAPVDEWADETTADLPGAKWRMTLPEGDYVLVAALEGYETGERECKVLHNVEVDCSIRLLKTSPPVEPPEDLDAGGGEDAPWFLDEVVAPPATDTRPSWPRDVMGPPSERDENKSSGCATGHGATGPPPLSPALLLLALLVGALSLKGGVGSSARGGFRP